MSGKETKTAGDPFMIIRLWPDHHKSEKLFNDLLKALRRYRRACDEVWFCTEVGFPALEAHRRSAELMAGAAEYVRQAGFGAGLQIANTIGHADVLMWPSDGITWRGMVGHDGVKAQHSGCPRDPALRDYTRQMIQAYAEWQPDSIWLDDDLSRMNNHVPVYYGCFCAECMKAFGKTGGRHWTSREALVKAIGNYDDSGVRLAWMEFCQQSMASLAQVVAEAVHAIAPACRMGLQHAGHENGSLYNGHDHAPIFQALADSSGLPVGSRPGAGFYRDHAPREMILKAYDLGRQAARVPKCVSQVCAEVENFSHIALGKTPHGTAVESMLDLALGCNSLSYAVVCSNHESMDWYGGILKNLAAWRPFFEEFATANRDTVPGGLHVAYGMSHAQRKLHPNEKPFAWAGISFNDMYLMATMGLPLTPHPGSACGSILTAKAIEGLSDDEIDSLLAGGLFMDGAAAWRLQDRGFGPKMGVAVELRDNDSFEYFTADSLNGEYSGHVWQIVFSCQGPVRSFALKPLTKRARVLGEYRAPTGASGAMTMVTETANGGRVAVFGYNGFEAVVSTARRHQILAAADWVSRGKLPVLIHTAVQVVAVPRVDRRGVLKGILLLNASLDQTPPIVMNVRNPAGKSAHLITPTGRGKLSTKQVGKNEQMLRLPRIKPWSVAWVDFDKANK